MWVGTINSILSNGSGLVYKVTYSSDQIKDLTVVEVYTNYDLNIDQQEYIQNQISDKISLLNKIDDVIAPIKNLENTDVSIESGAVKLTPAIATNIQE